MRPEPRVAAALLLGALALAGALVLGLRGPAPRDPTSAARLLRRLDLDGDGQLRADEAARLSRTGEPGWDLDGDGRVSAAELEAMVARVDPLWTVRQPAAAR
jgi:hypothetical protein